MEEITKKEKAYSMPVNGEILKDLFNFDVLHLNYQKQLATPLFHDIIRLLSFFSFASVREQIIINFHKFIIKNLFKQYYNQKDYSHNLTIYYFIITKWIF